MHDPNPAAAPDSVAAVECVIDRRLPRAFHELYLAHDGGWFLGNLNLMPLDDGSELSVRKASATYRGWVARSRRGRGLRRQRLR